MDQKQDQSKYKNEGRRNRFFNELFVFLTMIFVFISFEPVLAQCDVGSTVADFTLTGLDGETYQLHQFKNKSDYVLLYFIESHDSEIRSKILDVQSFFKENEPRETYQIIVVVTVPQDEQNGKEDFISLRKKLQLPFLFLWDEQAEVTDNYGIEKFPTVLLLKGDLSVRRTFSGLTGRIENSYYQYLKFAFTPKKKSNNSGCEGGVCPPPPGF